MRQRTEPNELLTQHRVAVIHELAGSATGAQGKHVVLDNEAAQGGPDLVDECYASMFQVLQSLPPPNTRQWRCVSQLVPADATASTSDQCLHAALSHGERACQYGVRVSLDSACHALQGCASTVGMDATAQRIATAAVCRALVAAARSPLADTAARRPRRGRAKAARLSGSPPPRVRHPQPQPVMPAYLNNEGLGERAVAAPEEDLEPSEVPDESDDSDDSSYGNFRLVNLQEAQPLAGLVGVGCGAGGVSGGAAGCGGAERSEFVRKR